MFKKLIAAVCAISLFASATQIIVSAAVIPETDISEMEETLNALGIHVAEIVFRDNFVQSLEGFVYEDPSIVSPSDAAYYMGLIESGEKFVGKSGFTVDEALKYAVITLGYKPVMDKMGSYVKIAAQLNLLNGIKSATDTRINHESAVRLLYNMLDAAPVKKLITPEDKEEYVKDNNSTILELNRNIYKIDGIMTANEYTSLYSAQDCERTGYIRIDEDKYILNDESAKELIGRSVEAYVREKKNGDYEIVYIREKSGNEMLEIATDDIETVSKDCSTVKYADAKDKIRTAKLETTLSFIYNGVVYADYKADDFKPNVGEIILIDNNSNGKYDVAVVNDYKTFVVKGIDTDNKVLRNGVTFKDSPDKIKVENDKYTDCAIYNSDGEKVDFSYIQTDDVLSVMQCKDAERVPIKIYIGSRNTVDGEVDTIKNADKELTVDGKTYEMSNDYLAYLAGMNKTLKVGDNCSFYTDYFGKIAYSVNMPADNYCMFYKVGSDGPWKYQIKYMDINGVWYTAPLAKNVKLDGVKTTPEKVFSETDGTQPQVVKIRSNTKDEVYSIDFAEATATYDENKFTKIGELTLYYREQDDDQRSFDCKYYYEKDAKMFVIPKDINDCDSYFVTGVHGFFEADKSYSLTIYDISKFNTSSIFSLNEGDLNSAALSDNSRERMIVTEVGQRLVDGNTRSFIRGGMGDYTAITFSGIELDTFNGIKEGDIVALGFNYNNEVNRVLKIGSAKTLTPKDTANYYSQSTMTGTVVDYDASKEILIVDCGKVAYFPLKSQRLIFKYSISANKVDAITPAEMMPGNKITFLNKYGSLKTIIYVVD